MPVDTHLGSMCKRGHDHQGTGMSLRDKRGRCILCKKLLDHARDTDFFGRSYKHKQRQAIDNKIPFNLTEDHLIELWDVQDGRDYWFRWLELSQEVASCPQKANIERLDPGKKVGYVIGNVVWASQLSNQGRGTYSATANELFVDQHTALHLKFLLQDYADVENFDDWQGKLLEFVTDTTRAAAERKAIRDYIDKCAQQAQADIAANVKKKIRRRHYKLSSPELTLANCATL
jgi:hypothetical protein